MYLTMKVLFIASILLLDTTVRCSIIDLLSQLQVGYRKRTEKAFSDLTLFLLQ